MTRQRIFDTLDDLITNFLYYDRKEDEELEVGSIEKAILDRVISVDEMVDLFRKRLVAATEVSDAR